MNYTQKNLTKRNLLLGEMGSFVRRPSGAGEDEHHQEMLKEALKLTY
jgi:hypothetical protein